MIKKYKLKGKITYLCKLANVSRSGYYNYFSLQAQEKRNMKEQKEEQLKNIILKAYHFKNRPKGARQIKMVLSTYFEITYNLKRIRRIMKKFNIICPIRKANAYKRMSKATKEHTVLPNLLKRNFKQGIPRKVLLTDITYLFYGKSKRAYLSTILDASTNEVLAYNVTDHLKLELAIDTLHKLKKKKIKLHEEAFIHSDQGVHYTSPKFQSTVKNYKIGQSMSRRGNCWDNALQESFFGHLKDEINIKDCQTLAEVQKEIKEYITYYNNYRCQWNLKKMTPVQYRNHLLDVA